MIYWDDRGKADDTPADDGRVRILIVEDDTRFADSLASLLSNAGWSVDTCASAGAGLGRVEADPYDLLLVDINLPDLSGHEMVRRVRERHERIPVIIISGETQIDAAIESLRLGASDFVRKPIEPEYLLHRIRTVLRQSWLEREYRGFQQRMHESERLHRFLVDHSPDLIFTLDAQGHLTYINDRVEEALGVERGWLLGRHLLELIHLDDRERVRYLLAEHARHPQAQLPHELRLISRLDTRGYRHYQVTLRTLPAGHGLKRRGAADSEPTAVHTYGIARDVTEQHDAALWTHHHLNYDSLTGLPNRQLFRDRLGLAIAQAQRSGERFAVVYLNLDRFSAINELYGHNRADAVLREVAQRLLRSLRGGDTLARHAADEFLLLNQPIARAEEVAAVIERIRQELSLPFVIEGKTHKLSLSAGVALYPEHGDTPEGLIRHANIALYHGRRSGLGGYAYFQEAMRADLDQRLHLEHQLQHALEQNQLELYFQPQVDVLSRRLRGVEALVRWHHPQRGLLAPGEFIAVAEETGLIIPLSKWVLAETARLLRQWLDRGIAPPRVAVNLSPRCLHLPDFVDCFMGVLGLHGVPAERIEVEITENLFIHDPTDAVQKLNALAARGIRIAIDDFGTQYSSLGYLQKFPIHTLKIDKSFVWEIDRDVGRHTLIKAIISIGHGLGLNLIAEGVETLSQLRFLQEQGCSDVQGYLISRPLPSSQIEPWLNHTGVCLGLST
ncbi:MAG: EAL domain-containing protein [Burkholderiales bacterium]|nr:EAL domain-containing protein [Burkholderiales bacterium]